MTDKTLKKAAENQVNTQAALAKTTDTARDSKPKSRTLPQADALKVRFKAGSIPLQTDFADVIDLANVGRQAVGGAEGQTGPANGFTLSSMGRLELKPNAAKGISVDQDGVAIKLKTISGLTMDKDGVSVKPKADSGIELKDSAGISLKPGNGISVDKDGIAVKAEQNKGLQVNNNGVSVKVGKGMRVSSTGMIEPDVDSYSFGIVEEGVEYSPVKVNTSTNSLVVDLHQGLIHTVSGLSVNVGNGLQADHKNGVSLIPEQMFQKGMVMMFAGTEAEMPKGWALCDGKDGRPDLQDRFVLGSTGFTNVGKTNDKRVTGTNINKEYMVPTTAVNTKVSVTVGEHVLTESQIPKHFHEGGSTCLSSAHTHSHAYGYNHYDLSSDHYHYTLSASTSPNDYLLSLTSSVGGGGGHSHTAKVTENAHIHNVSVVPPYFILAFIIKL